MLSAGTLYDLLPKLTWELRRDYVFRVMNLLGSMTCAVFLVFCGNREANRGGEVARKGIESAVLQVTGALRLRDT